MSDNLVILQNHLTTAGDTLDTLLATLAQPSSAPWSTDQNRPLREAPIFGVGGRVAEALSWALAKMYYIQQSGYEKAIKQYEEYRKLYPDQAQEPTKPEGIHIGTRLAGPGATLRQNTDLAQGYWVVHNAAWGAWGSSPRALKQMASSRLVRKTGYDRRSCYQAIQAAISTCYSEWQLAVMDHYGPRAIDDGQFYAGDCQVCGQTWAPKPTADGALISSTDSSVQGTRYFNVWVRTDYSLGWNQRRSACKECWEQHGLEAKQPDLEWHEGTCAKCNATSGDHKTWVVSNICGDKDICHNCYEQLKQMHWCICPRCDEQDGVVANSSRPIVEGTEFLHNCTTCGHRF